MENDLEETNISKPFLETEDTNNEIESHEKSVQIFETEKDFKKYKSLFPSADEFNNNNCKRFIKETLEDFEAEIKTYIIEEKLDQLEMVDFKRKINGINVHIITFRQKTKFNT